MSANVSKRLPASVFRISAFFSRQVLQSTRFDNVR